MSIKNTFNAFVLGGGIAIPTFVTVLQTEEQTNKIILEYSFPINKLPFSDDSNDEKADGRPNGGSNYIVVASSGYIGKNIQTL